MNKRERNESNDAYYKEQIALFDELPDELVVEIIIGKGLNIIQIYNLCQALGKQRDLCARYEIWDRLFIRRFGSKKLNEIKEWERLNDPLKRVATYTLYSILESARAKRLLEPHVIHPRYSILAADAAELRFAHNSLSDIYMFAAIGDDNVDTYVDAYSIPNNESRYDTELVSIYALGICNDILIQYDLAPLDILYDEPDAIKLSVLAMHMKHDVHARAIIYALLSRGWYPVTLLENQPIWTKACVLGCENKAIYGCAGCKRVSYCGKECALKHWPEHERHCRK